MFPGLALLDFIVSIIVRADETYDLDDFVLPENINVTLPDLVFVIRWLPFVLQVVGFSAELAVSSMLGFFEVIRHFIMQHQEYTPHYNYELRIATRNAIFQAWRVSMAYDWTPFLWQN